MSDDHYNQPAKGAEDWDEPLNENFADLGVEVANEVATWGDLPATTEVSQSSDGQWPVYRVADDAVFVRVTDSATEIVGGLGSADHPLPESHHEAINTDSVFSGRQTIYVRSDGDDTEDGLSANTAKQTVEAALSEAPLHLDGTEPFVLDLGTGTFSYINLKHFSAANSIKVSGATDGNGNPATTIDAADQYNTLDASGVFVDAENLVIQNGSFVNVRAGETGSVDLSNCQVKGGSPTEFNARSVGSSFLQIRGDCVFDWSAGSGSASAHVESIAAHARVDDAVISGGANQGSLVAKQSAYIELYGPTVDADGGSDCVYLRDGSDAKVGDPQPTLKNASNGFNLARNCDLTVKSDEGGPTFENISVEKYKFRDDSYMRTADGTDAWVPPTGTTTDVSNAFDTIGNLMFFDTDTDLPRYYVPTNDEFLIGGLREVASGTVSLNANGAKDVSIEAGTTNLLVSHGPNTNEGGFVEYAIRNTGGGNTIVRFRETSGSPATHNYSIWAMPLP